MPSFRLWCHGHGAVGKVRMVSDLHGRARLLRRLRQPLPAQEKVMLAAVGLRPLPLPRLQGK